MKNANFHAHAAAPRTAPGLQTANLTAAGDCPLADSVAVLPTASYTDADMSRLLFMIEEEKLSGDVYDALWAQTGLKVFDRIGDAEDRQMSILLDHAETLGLNLDSILSLPAGSYSDPGLQAMFDALMLSASVSDRAALEVGVSIEQADIADLEAAVVDLAGTPLGQVYANLLIGSNRHLDAFEGWLA